MKRKVLVWMALIVAALLLTGVSASATVYGGREEREALRSKQVGNPANIRGDVGGVFTAALNATQPVYYTYDWNRDFFSLAKPLGESATSSWYRNQGSNGPDLSFEPAPKPDGSKEKPYQISADESTLDDYLKNNAGNDGYPPKTGSYYLHNNSSQFPGTYYVTWNADGTVTVTPAP